ncbi:GSCFA domain-containing protein [Maribacter sp. PR1]|uniref:GSCFA domain-containing protein n=1 Tax=Maribacter cobaltidurans TaxID=1178778 RepID=A0ABU7ITI1_9FLAO|nr:MULTISPECIES: GSCFA domain-containing protein [Maribacter]MDC6388796.1 GSCFA domain-containing protein [Maribacter sp. PR1]MEE1976185.1 GSCFA domain-containing protein [Maribacter cobaltidurans]
MKLQTQIPLEPISGQLDYSSKILMLGSCFSQNMGAKLDYYQFQTLQNPFGILFNPLAIDNLLQKALNKYEYLEEDIFRLNGRWHCFDAHSNLSSASKEELLKNLNIALTRTNQFLREASHVFITLGTAWVYQHEKSNQFVANCHKVPQKEFGKHLLNIDEIRGSLQSIASAIEEINPDTSIVLTISPVRHLKDGFVENQRSKSHLITAVHELLGVLPLGIKGFYFPSYEIMMDELRDYRFYERDMVHPNSLAIDYIWEKFKEVLVSKDVEEVMEQVAEIQKGLAHRPFDVGSEAHQKFLKSLTQKIAYIKSKYPFMNFGNSS